MTTPPIPTPPPEIEPGEHPTPELGHGGGVGGPIPMLRAQPLDTQDTLLGGALGVLRSMTRHLMFVREGIGYVTAELERRATVHDASKFLDDEFAGFSRINAAARIHKFGSPEYAEGMRQERGTIDLHFTRNSHHPELHDQTFLDVIEMVCDWWGARKGYDDPRSWSDTVELNFAQKAQHLTGEQLWLARQVAAFLATKERAPA